MLFSKELRKWRGKRLQKEVCDMLGVNIRTYQAWELGVRKPSEITLIVIRDRMEANKEKL